MSARLTTRRSGRIGTVLGAALLLTHAASGAYAQAGASGLRLEEVVAEGDDAFHVVATLIVGPTESVLWDAQYKVSDGKRLAERIAGTGTRLKAIVISHADHDHYMGALEVLRRFPGTPVYMAASTLADFNARSSRDLVNEKSRPNAEPPDSLVSPQVLPSMSLTVDGNRLAVIADLTGDVRKSALSALWIPSLKAALVADLAFSGVHPWLGDSDIASRARWRASLKRIADLKPEIVVPGHKRDAAAPNSPELLRFMDSYLSDFDTFMQTASTPDELIQAMRRKYSDLSNPGLMGYGARTNFKK